MDGAGHAIRCPQIADQRESALSAKHGDDHREGRATGGVSVFFQGKAGLGLTTALGVFFFLAQDAVLGVGRGNRLDACETFVKRSGGKWNVNAGRW